MGGNGQFNRLAALDDVADDAWSWRDRLTEDQDLGLRLIAAGWQGRQELGADRPPAGSLGACGRSSASARAGRRETSRPWRSRDVWRAPGPLGPRLELLAYLLMPLWQGIVGRRARRSHRARILGLAPFWDDGPGW